MKIKWFKIPKRKLKPVKLSKACVICRYYWLSQELCKQRIIHA